jgi:hypothetical protein
MRNFWTKLERGQWWGFCSCITPGHQCGGRECVAGPFKTAAEAQACIDRLTESDRRHSAKS